VSGARTISEPPSKARGTTSTAAPERRRARADAWRWTVIELPAQLRDLDLPLVVSVSGGKDSTACMIALRAAGLPFRAVFADTGWEALQLDACAAELERIAEEGARVSVG